MPQNPTTRDAIKRLIRRHGPLTCAQLCARLKKPMPTVSSCLSTSRSGSVKHFYIVRYEPQIGKSGMPAGVFALGDKPDAPRPEFDRAVIAKRFYKNHKARIAATRRKRNVNPFKVAAGHVTAPEGVSGRVFNLLDDKPWRTA
jgi:hypothetical protein